MSVDKLIISRSSCELCAKEYISRESEKLSQKPLDQNKSSSLERILRGARKHSTKLCVQIPCDFGVVSHSICCDHLYKLIDSIKEYEEESKEE